MTHPPLLHRFEWAAAALLVAGAMFYLVDFVEVGPTSIGIFVILLAAPDVTLFFLPDASDGSSWPYAAYNFAHTLTNWVLVFVPALLLGWPHAWALTGWLLHILFDRAVGYDLRYGDGRVARTAPESQ